MTSQGNVEIYRRALEHAITEAAEITASLEQLRVRKEHIERLVTVLGPFIGETPSVAAPSEILPQQEVEHSAQHAGEETIQRETVPSDPFQRRIDHVLGIGAGIRDVRKYSRQF